MQSCLMLQEAEHQVPLLDNKRWTCYVTGQQTLHPLRDWIPQFTSQDSKR
jgi:hypothetical protein